MADRSKTEYGVVHTSATPLTMKLTNESLRAMHKARGFSDIGYNEWIDQQGVLHTGRGLKAMGAHVAGFNSISYGIMWEGGHKGLDINPKQQAALGKRMKEVSKIYPSMKWCGHRDLSPDGDKDGVVEPHEWTKMCPWFDAEILAQKLGLPHTNFSGKASSPPVTQKTAGPDDRIMYLQKLLRGEGYSIGVDGWIGDETKSVIRLFQQERGLVVNGEFDAATVLVLRNRAEEREVEPVIVNNTTVSGKPSTLSVIIAMILAAAAALGADKFDLIKQITEAMQ